MLRYYDEIGLLPGVRMQDRSYRLYDRSAVRRLQQIIALRKLRIPLKKIAMIFNNADQGGIINVFHESIDGMDSEITALRTIRDILRLFVLRLNPAACGNASSDMFDDTEIMRVIQILSLTKIHFKEDQSMDSLNKANETLSVLKNVRIIHVPPCTVAASNYIGESPEHNAFNPLNEFIGKIGLKKSNPT